MIKSTVPRFHDPKAAVQSRPVKAEPKKTTATKPAPQSTVKTTAVPTQSRASTATNQSRPKSGVKTKEETKKQVENKENTAPQGLYTDKPSAKLHNFKRSDPFASKNNLKTYYLLLFLHPLIGNFKELLRVHLQCWRYPL